VPFFLARCRLSLGGVAREVFADAAQQLRELDARIAAHERRIAALVRASEPVQRLMKIEGVGPITATAIVASVGNAAVFKVRHVREIA
jgi:transposase